MRARLALVLGLLLLAAPAHAVTIDWSASRFYTEGELFTNVEGYTYQRQDFTWMNIGRNEDLDLRTLDETGWGTGTWQLYRPYGWVDIETGKVSGFTSNPNAINFIYPPAWAGWSVPTAVPEPATWVFLGMGLIGLALGRRRWDGGR